MDEFKFKLKKITAEVEAERGVKWAVDDSVQLKALVSKGWVATYTALFGQSFTDALANHHAEAIDWHWNARLAFLKGEHPEYLAYFPIWSRGHMKSSIAERMVVVDAILSITYKQPGYCLYLSRNKDKVQEHIANIETLLASEKVRKICPSLSTPQRTEITNQQRRWTSSFLKTQANYAILGGTLESGLAGSRVEETRPTFIVPDDIDSREDSPVIAESRFRQLTTEILPMRQDNTLVFFAQNLISRFSVMYRIQTGQARVLTNRKPTEPVPAVIDLKTEVRTINGIPTDVYISGVPTWHIWDAQRIQDEINTEGLPSFLRECNHEVEASKEGVILYNYDDDVHVISESEFAAVFGSVDAWLTWRKKPGNDWARTKTDKHANVAAWLCKSSSDEALPNFTFLMHPMSFPADTAPEDVAERLISCLDPYAYKVRDEKVTWAELRKRTVRRIDADQYTKTIAEKIAYEHGELSKIIPKYSVPLLQRCNVQQGEMSHEQDTVRKIYAGIYHLAMKATNPKKHGGTEDINRAMRVDRNEPHAFRPDAKGYTQWAMVVPDDKDRPYKEIDGRTIYHPRPYPTAMQTNDIVDSDLCRFQLNNARYQPPKLTTEGEVIDAPEKIYDDFFNLLQFFYVGNPLQGTSLTLDQKVKLIVPREVQERVVEAKTADEKFTSFLDLEFQRNVALDKLVPEEDRFSLEWE